MKYLVGTFTVVALCYGLLFGIASGERLLDQFDRPLDGYQWVQLTEKEKVLYVSGFLDAGIMRSPNGAIVNIGTDDRATDLQVLVENVNRFYAVEKNRRGKVRRLMLIGSIAMDTAGKVTP